MIKFKELKQGDYVLAETEGQQSQGEVKDFNNDEKQVAIDNGVQEFWFSTEDLYPITLDEEQLTRLKFSKQVQEDGKVKYSKGAFRILTPSQGKFSDFEIWYRDESRLIQGEIPVHILQNHYLEMTKIHLTNKEM